MKLISTPMSTTEYIDTSYNGAPVRMAGRAIMSDVEIFLPMQITAEDKVWNKLKYGRTGELRVGEKIDRIDFSDDGFILYGVLPLQEAWDIQLETRVGRTFTCRIDRYEIIEEN